MQSYDAATLATSEVAHLSPWQLLDRWLRHIQESRLTDGLPAHSADDPLFPKLTRGKRILYSEPMSVNAIYERAKYLLDAYLGKKGSPHAFRRGKLTSTIDQHGVEVAKAIARHADISTTLGYDMREIDRMHKAVEESDLLTSNSPHHSTARQKPLGY